MKFFQRLRAHFLKITLTIVATGLVVQYWRYISVDSQRFEPLFFIESFKSKLKMGHATENETLFEVAEIYINDTSSHNSSSEAHNNSTSKQNNETLLCPIIPPNLNGPINIITEFQQLSEIEKSFEGLEPGGMFRPKECKSRYIVALVIPYRNRPTHLSIFLNNIHRLLMKQQIDYEIFVIEQDGGDPFNRGKLMNVGFVEANKVKDFDCFIFHDVDLIPEDDRNLYTCPEQPRHMSVAVDTFHYRLPYKELFGGVCALKKNHFFLTNGFSNSFWGWGGEDDDMYSRVRRRGLYVARYPPTIARYKMLPHSKQRPSPKRFEMLQKGKKLYKMDGLNNLDYKRKSIKFNKLYTWILVDLHPPR